MRGKVVVSSDVVVGELGTFRSEGNQVESDHPKLSRYTFASSNSNLRIEEVQVEPTSTSSSAGEKPKSMTDE